jgi:8-oxo-dGTP pyrophosphatase MutT (NUDIX family)
MASVSKGSDIIPSHHLHLNSHQKHDEAYIDSMASHKLSNNHTFSYLEICQRCNNMTIEQMAKQGFYPFFVQRHHVGFIHPTFRKFLEKHFPQEWAYFNTVESKRFHAIIESLDLLFDKRIYLDADIGSSSDKATLFFESLFINIKKWVDKNPDACNEEASGIAEDHYPILKPLQGWREEKYGVYADPLRPAFSIQMESTLIQSMRSGKNVSLSPLLFQIERSAISLLGVVGYGVHANGVVIPSTYSKDHGEYDDKKCLDRFILLQESKRTHWKMWIAKRSASKFTWPCKLDQLSAGGLSANYTPHSTLVKECWEEAGLDPDYTMEHAVPVGTISYCQSSHSAVTPKIQFIYDLFLDEDFVPKALDGEVHEFHLWTIDEVLRHVKLGEFKPNCALVILNFCIRHGIIRWDNEPEYHRILAAMHTTLPF